MEIIQGEGPCHIELLLKGTGGPSCRNLPKSLPKSAINANDMPQTSINQGEPSTPFLVRGVLHNGGWILSDHSPKQPGTANGSLSELIILPSESKRNPFP